MFWIVEKSLLERSLPSPLPPLCVVMVLCLVLNLDPWVGNVVDSCNIVSREGLDAQKGIFPFFFLFSFFVFVVRLPACKYLPPAHRRPGQGNEEKVV